MNTALIIILVLVGIVVLIGLVVVFWGIGTYNKLVSLREGVRNGWSQIEVLLKRRHDLIPNLVETVKGYASHESETLEAVIAARNGAVAANGVESQGQAEGALSGALRQLFAVAESYPDLKANQNFSELQTELANTENGIAGQRQGYNNTVKTYNETVQQVPANFIAGPFGFTKKPFFEVTTEAEREAPGVKF
ncbi:MAG: LemA family protein [Planctomycetota bacterium]